MKQQLFMTAKSGLPDEKNEDAVFIKNLDKKTLMVVMSDGASTGVFSRQWSTHLTKNFDSSWLESDESFNSGLESLRESFKPKIDRPSAQRKFLLEGSYATVFASTIERVSVFFSSRLKLTNYCIGDVSLFVYSRKGELKYTFPFTSASAFGNVPHLVRSSDKHQKKSPATIRSDEFSAAKDDLLIYATDAISEFLFKAIEKKSDGQIIQRVRECKTDDEFRDLMDHYRTKCGMHNDDVAILFLEAEK